MGLQLEFKIPLTDNEHGTSFELSHQMARFFSETTSNKFFSIQYELEIYVKHDSITERGLGRVVRFPININFQSQHELFSQLQSLQLEHD